MSILWRLNAMIAALVLTLLACFTIVMLIEAQPRIRTENESMTLLAREFFLKSIDTLAHSPDPKRDLEDLVEKLQGVRHISINLVRPARSEFNQGSRQTVPNRPGGDSSAISTAGDAFHMPVMINDRNLGMVIITPRPSDEISEIQDATASVALTSLAVSAFAFLAVGYATRRTLKPIDDLGIALGRMQAGDYDVGVATGGPPEIADIARRLNALAATLRKARQENRRLSQKLVEAQDNERRDIAHELHDELGPVLFAVRATGTSLKSEADKPAADRQKISRLASSMLEHIEGLQATNKRVLRRIAPAGLEELGLCVAIDGIIALWRKQHPEVTITLRADTADIDDVDPTTTLTVYRMIQESITNALRHGHPSRVDVEIGRHRADGSHGPGDLMVRVTDDGCGLPTDARPGFGLTSMRERVAALGGTLTIAGAGGRGTCLTMHLPVGPDGQRPAVEEAGDVGASTADMPAGGV